MKYFATLLCINSLIAAAGYERDPWYQQWTGWLILLFIAWVWWIILKGLKG